jgi:hypothetical protein
MLDPAQIAGRRSRIDAILAWQRRGCSGCRDGSVSREQNDADRLAIARRRRSVG